MASAPVPVPEVVSAPVPPMVYSSEPVGAGVGKILFAMALTLGVIGTFYGVRLGFLGSVVNVALERAFVKTRFVALATTSCKLFRKLLFYVWAT